MDQDKVETMGFDFAVVIAEKNPIDGLHGSVVGFQTELDVETDVECEMIEGLASTSREGLLVAAQGKEGSPGCKNLVEVVGGRPELRDVWEGCAIAQLALVLWLLMNFAARVALVWYTPAEPGFAETYAFVLLSSAEEVLLVVHFLNILYFAHQNEKVSEGALGVWLLARVLLEILP